MPKMLSNSELKNPYRYPTTRLVEQDPSEVENAIWLDSLADWKIALTLTFTTKKFSGDPRFHSDLVKTTKFLITRINGCCFGHGAKRKKYRVASAFTVECGYDGSHPHVHASLSLPPEYSFERFRRIILRECYKLHSIANQIDVQPYRDFGWQMYSLKTGVENVVIEEIKVANPKG